MTQTRLRRNPFRIGLNGPEKFCSGCGQYVLVTEYSRRKSGPRTGELLSRCKACICKAKTRHNEVSGYVPLSKVYHIFDEIAERVGQRRAAAAVGISEAAYASILKRRQRNVQKRRVYHAITFLRCLRMDRVWDKPKVGRPLTHKKPYQTRYCPSCGTDYDHYTPGCDSCSEREAKRPQHNREQGVMKLTRPQIVGLYGLVMNMPPDTEVEVISEDTYGHLIIKAESESTGREARFKLPTDGGTQVLS